MLDNFDFGHEPDFFDTGFDTSPGYPEEAFEYFEQYGKAVTDSRISELSNKASSFRYLTHESVNKIELQPGQKITFIVEGLSVAYQNDTCLTQIVDAKIAPPVGWTKENPYTHHPQRKGHPFEINIFDKEKNKLSSIIKEKRRGSIEFKGPEKSRLKVAELTKYEKKETRYYMNSLKKLNCVKRDSMMLNVNGAQSDLGAADLELALDSIQKFSVNAQIRKYGTLDLLPRITLNEDMRRKLI